MSKIINGITLADAMNRETTKLIAKLKKKNGKTPKFGVVLVGDNAASKLYVEMKGNIAEQVGMDFVQAKLPASASLKRILDTIDRLQADPNLSGLIVQLPLPNPKHTLAVLNRIREDIDIDCLTDRNIGKLVMGSNLITPPTAAACMSILESLKVDLVGKNVTLVGVGPLVGKPLAIMMMNARASVTTCNSRTKDMKAKCLNADIVVSGVGKKYIIKGDMVKKGAIVIDAGVSFENGKSYGDVDVESVAKRATFVTPTPGGVGPLTVAHLLRNTVVCAEKKS